MNKEDYMKLARGFLVEAKRQLDDYRKTGNELSLRQACEKGWGSVVQALMAAAGKPIESHKDFGLVASDLFRKTSDRRILTGESAGEYLHGAGFYHGLPTAELVSNSLELIEGLIEAIERFL